MNIAALSEEQSQTQLTELNKEWSIKTNKLCREFTFSDFSENLAFVNKVAAIAEEMDHHPDFHVYYNRLVIETWTHSVDGLSIQDFALAKRIDSL